MKHKSENHSEEPYLLSILKAAKANPMFFIAVVMLTVSLLLTFQAILLERRTLKFVSIAKTQSPLPIDTDLNMGNVELRISKIVRSPGQPHFQAPTGKEYLVLNLTVQNRSDRSIQVLPTIDTYVKDQDGNVYYMTPFVVDNPFHSGELPVGEKISGQLSYLVPKSKSLKLYVDGIWSGGVVSFKLP